jgi:hypothetical protein
MFSFVEERGDEARQADAPVQSSEAAGR